MQADKGQMPIDDLLVSLTGWRDFVNLSASMFLQRKLTLEPLPSEDRPQLKVTAVSKSSVIIDLLLVIAGTAFGGMFSPDLRKLRKRLFEWIGKGFNSHVEQKRLVHVTVEEAAEALEKLAEENDIQKPEIHGASIQIVEELDKALKRASQPVEKSAERLQVTTDYFDIPVDRNKKRALHSGFYVPSEEETYFRATVLFRELSLETSHCFVEIIKSDNPIFSGRATCYVSDSSIKEPRNDYSRSLDDQKSLEIWVQPVRNKRTGTIDRWYVRRELPRMRTPLFSVSEDNND